MSSIVRWGSYSLDQVDETDKSIDSIAGGVFLDLGQGDNVVRFLPPLLGKTNPFRVTAQHYVKGLPGLDKMFVFACPRHELRQQCFVCQKCEELSRSPIADDRNRAKSWQAGLRVFANVVARSKMEAGPRVLAFGKMIWEDLKKIRKNARLGGDFTNPGPDGFDIIITREGTGMETSYSTAADRGSSPLAATEEQIELLISQQHDLDALIDPITPEDLLAALGVSIRQQVAVAQSLLPTGRSQAPAGPGVGAGLMASRAQASTVVSGAPAAAVQATPVPARTAAQDADDSAGDGFLDA